MRARKFRVVLVQQGVWAMPLESMPLAVGYLKAALDASPRLAGEVDSRIVNVKGGVSIGQQIVQVFADGVPDMLAVSVFGWNFRDALILAETFKQLNPSGLVVLGGTHVANQGDRVFRLSGDVDIVVNGEGEEVLVEIVEAHLSGTFPDQAGGPIAGISYRREDGTSATTAERGRIMDLTSIPSPFITGAIPMTDHMGRFRYDVALMETNRGCPYKCAFCYWGGAIGQKFRSFDRDRIREELEIFAHHKVETIVLCDSNFGMLGSDEEFVEDVVKLRERTGYPLAIESSWAKNKSKTFYRIVEQMHEAGLHSSFTIALQTMNDDVLRLMNRRNMKINDWSALAKWLVEKGMATYAELIWCAPGEDRESFLKGYDDLALQVQRIAVYPLMLLPNTEYVTQRELHSFVTTRGEADDFEYVLATKDISYAENLDMQGFLLWARAVAENQFFKYIWLPLRRHAGLTQSQVLLSVAEWFDQCEDPATDTLKSPAAFLEPLVVNSAVRSLYLNVDVRDLLRRWWSEAIVPQLPPASRPRLEEVFRFEMDTLPLAPGERRGEVVGTTRSGHSVQRRRAVYGLDVPMLVDTLAADIDAELPPAVETTFDFEWRGGIEEYVDNHEGAIHYRAAVTVADSVVEVEPVTSSTPVSGSP